MWSTLKIKKYRRLISKSTVYTILLFWKLRIFKNSYPFIPQAYQRFSRNRTILIDWQQDKVDNKTK